jgi:protein CpxP
MKQFRNRLLIGITAFGLGTGAFAAAGDMHHHGGKGPDQTSGHAHEGRAAKMQERAAKRQAELHQKLQLTAAQEAAWTTFVERMKPAQRPARPDRAAWAAASAPERMEMMLTRMKDREKMMTDRLAAVREFYRALSADQHKVFNAEFGRGRHHRRA